MHTLDRSRRFGSLAASRSLGLAGFHCFTACDFRMKPVRTIAHNETMKENMRCCSAYVALPEKGTWEKSEKTQKIERETTRPEIENFEKMRRVSEKKQ